MPQKRGFIRVFLPSAHAESLKRVLFSLILAVVLSSAYGQDYVGRIYDDFVLKIAVYGPSDDIFIWWGHAALIVENTMWDFSLVYDWGIFTYPSDDFLKDFIGEQVRYKCTSGDLYLDGYIDEDRDITVYTLNLDGNAKKTIMDYARNNVLPENCYYDYHEFRNNCSTRIRDIIDMGTGGQFKAAFDSVPGRFSIRQHMRRFIWSRPVSDWFLGFMIGQDVDEKITPWDEMFLPVEIARNIVDFKYTDSSGVERKLVNSVQIYNSSKNRQPVLNAPLETWPFALTAGLIAAAMIFLIKGAGKKYPRLSRILMGTVHSLAGLFLGGCGYALVFGFFMNNDYFKQNANILFVNPLLLVTAPLGILYAAGKQFRFNPEKCLRALWTYVFAAGCLTILMRALPFFYQQNQSVQGIVLPIAFALGGIPGQIRKLKLLTKHI
jgi:hypothetical protein